MTTTSPLPIAPHNSYPILLSPGFKIPLLHIVVAFKIDIIQLSVLHHKIGGIVVNIGIRRVQKAAHFLHLPVIVRLHCPFGNQLGNGFASDIGFQDALLLLVCIQQLRHGNADFLQAGIVPQFGLKFVAKLIVVTRFVVQLLEDKFISGFIRSQIGIAALALPQQLFDGKFFSVDR